MSFDIKGFLFALGFFGFLAVLVFAARFSVPLALDYLSPASQDTSELDAQLTLLKSRRASPLSEKIVLGFVGDIMLDRGVKQAVFRYGKGDFRFPFLNVAETLQRYDILFGNLEGPISDRGMNQGSIYSFRMDPRAIEGLQFVGFDIFSVANNHIVDWGPDAEDDTLRRLEEAGIKYVGAGLQKEEIYTPRVIEVKNTRIAFVAASEFRGSDIALIEDKEIKKAILRARAIADIVIVSFHFGEEYEPQPSNFQKRISRRAIDLGADLVVGHHPHVAQPLEEYHGRTIAYSLGNFVFDQNFSRETMKGLLLEGEVEGKKISHIRTREIIINHLFQPAFSEN